MTLGHIAVDGTSYSSTMTGTARRTLELAPRLAEYGWTVTLFLTKSALSDTEELKNVNIVRLPINLVPGPLRAIQGNRHLARAFKNAECQILLSETPPFGIKTPTVFTIHDLAVWDVPEHCSRGRRLWRKSCVPRALRQASTVITVSDFSAQRLKKYFSKHQAMVIPNGCDHLPLSGVNASDKNYFLVVGPNDRFRNWSAIIQAVDKLRDIPRYHNIELVFVGAPSTTVLPKWVLQREAKDIELSQLYQNAKAIICESIYEGFDFPLAEALHANCQVVASDIPVHREVAKDTAHFFTLNDELSLQNALCAAIENPIASNLLCAQSQKYNWNRSCKLMHEVLLTTLRQAT